MLHRAWLVPVLLLLAACAGPSGALVASGGISDVKAIGPLAEEFGEGAPAAIVPVDVAGKPLDFNVWVSKAGNRIMVQSGSAATIAAAGFVRGLSAGLIDAGAPEFAPFERAALSFVAQRFGAKCRPANSRVIARVGYSWDVVCA